MKTLHWHTDADPCMIGNHPVTPESWGESGIVAITENPCGIYSRGWTDADTFRWMIDESGHGSSAPEHYGKYCAPVYPPRGFGGLDEWEMWNLLNDDKGGVCDLVSGLDWQVGLDWHDRSRSPVRLRCGVIERGDEYHDCTVDYDFVADPPALILALQNAQVLSNRLKERA